MSIVRFSGGLGNQLFQLSFAQSLQRQSKESSAYDLIEYRFPTSNSAHKLEVNALIENSAVNSPKLIFGVLPTRVKKEINVVLRKRLSQEALYGLEVRRERDEIFDDNLKIAPGGYYVGNFISHRYWNGCTKQNIELIRGQLEALSKTTIESKRDSIAIHVRRGDYILNQKTRRFHGYCADSYYLNALKQSLDEHPYLRHVSIASDSLNMVSELTDDIKKLGLKVDYITEKRPIETLISLTSYSVFIGSNSTFSWWAAALTEKNMSFFPKDWFASGNYGYSPETFFPFPVITVPNALNTL